MTPEERRQALYDAIERGPAFMPLIETWIVDERRRTADKIRRRIESAPPAFTAEAVDALKWAARIAGEVGETP